MSRKNTKMSEQANAARAAYYRKWRKKNPEKQKEYNRRYWEKKARELAAGSEDFPADPPVQEEQSSITE